MSLIKMYLRNIRDEQQELRALRRMLHEKRLDLIPPGINYDRIRVQTTPSDRTTDRMVEAVELEKAIEEHIRALDDRKAEASRIIAMVDDPMCRVVLELYYLALRENGKPVRWGDVAEIMGYSEDWVKHMHGVALAKLAEIIEEEDIEGEKSTLKNTFFCDNV